MLPQNNPDRIRIVFDDHRLVANAGYSSDRQCPIVRGNSVNLPRCARPSPPAFRGAPTGRPVGIQSSSLLSLQLQRANRQHRRHHRRFQVHRLGTASIPVHRRDGLLRRRPFQLSGLAGHYQAIHTQSDRAVWCNQPFRRTWRRPYNLRRYIPPSEPRGRLFRLRKR